MRAQKGLDEAAQVQSRHTMMSNWPLRYVALAPIGISSMITLFFRLWLAVGLILAASAVLLFTDRERASGGVRTSRTSEAGWPSRTWKIGLAAFVESAPIEEAIDGFRRGLDEAGLVDGRDFTITTHNAQGDIATLNAILDHLNGDVHSTHRTSSRWRLTWISRAGSRSRSLLKSSTPQIWLFPHRLALLENPQAGQTQTGNI